MIDLRPILIIVGMLTAVLGVFMLIPAAVDLASSHPDWRIFALSAGLTFFVGGSLAAANWGHGRGGLTVQQGFLLTVASWVALVAVAALPLTLSSLQLSYTDAFFEAMSGLTTTGATVIVGLNEAPRGVLLWRALLQWLGGVGIVIMAIAILPMLQVGGMQLFRTESSDTSEKILPRAGQIAGSIFRLYIALSFVCFGAYWAAGMSSFDALAHAMTTIATGGFSTRDESFGAFADGPADLICIVFMILGSLPFALYLLAVRGNFDPLWEDAQVRFFLGAATLFIAAMVLFQIGAGVNSEGDAIRYGMFNVISIMTG
ncbi:MAG: potassium transporter TrkG, partial [Pseudomonadota bacterium]